MSDPQGNMDMLSFVLRNPHEAADEIERLETHMAGERVLYESIIAEAAERLEARDADIERLEADNARLRAALRELEAALGDDGGAGWALYREVSKLKARIEGLEADNARLTAALETIFSITDEEIAVRFRTDSRKTEEQVAGKSTVYSMLSVPRNIARKALEKAEKSK